MRHSLKALKALKAGGYVKNEDDYGVCVCVRPPEHVPQNDSKQTNFLSFSP
jgi:hypothetical protein